MSRLSISQESVLKMEFTIASLSALKRSELQHLAKDHGVKANLKTSDIIKELLQIEKAPSFADTEKSCEETAGVVNPDLSWPSLLVERPKAQREEDRPRDSAGQQIDQAPSDGAVCTVETKESAPSLSGEPQEESKPEEKRAENAPQNSALPEVAVRFCVVDGLKVASSHWHKLVLRAGSLQVKSTRDGLGDCSFVLQVAPAVQDAPEDHESDNLVCDACAIQNAAKSAARATGKGCDKAEEGSATSDQPLSSPPDEQTPNGQKRPLEAAAFGEYSPLVVRPATVAPRSTVKKSALMTPAERQQDRIMRARLQQSEKREKLFMARRNLELDAGEDGAEADVGASRSLPVASILHKKKLPMTASLDPARLLGSPSTQQGQ